jgi:hypothetical protein
MTGIDMVPKENADYSPKAVAMSDFGTSRRMAPPHELVPIGTSKSNKWDQIRTVSNIALFYFRACTAPRAPISRNRAIKV